MVGVLNPYLDPQLSYTWCEASLTVAKSIGKGIQYESRQARNICTWIHKYLATSKLPTHHYGQHSVSILDDKDFTLNIQEHLLAIVKDGYIQAQDIVDYISIPEVQAKLNAKKQSISIWTAQHWLKNLEWDYGQRKKGMYIDGHE